MKTKNIFKALAFPLLMPAMLLTTACSSDNDVITNNENINKKGYEIPVTLNATRQGDDATTRATYNPDTRKLEYSTGDQLYVFGNHETAGMYGGVLEWKGGIIFSGTITTTNQYSGSGVELLSSAIWARAQLLPADYNNYNYLDIETNNPFISYNYGNTFATSKTIAIEQFSNETVLGYSNGFALVPQNAILNFTITGLTPNTEFAVELWNSYYGLIEGNVTTNGSGTATFAIGIDISVCTEHNNIDNLYDKGWDLRMKDNNNDYVLRMYDDNNPLVTSSTPLVAGHIYNISRSVTPAPSYPSISTVTTSDYGKVVCAAGHLHDANTPVPTGCTGVGVIAKVTDGGHGLIMALQDAGECAWQNIYFCTSVTYAGSTMKRLEGWMLGSLPSYNSLGSISVSNWCVAQKSDYETMFANLGSTHDNSFDNNVNDKITSAGGTALSDGDSYLGYWCATQASNGNGWSFKKNSWDDESYYDDNTIYTKYLRPVLGF